MEEEKSKDSKSASKTPFSSLPIDRRVFKALARIGLVTPTTVQSSVLQHALEGRDILCKAGTGSGKTLAFCIPMMETVLRDVDQVGTKALILVPSHELTIQVQKVVKDMLFYAPAQVKCTTISGQGPIAAQLALLKEHPDIVVATPTRLMKILRRDASSFKESLKVLILDEADLLLSYGYEDDVRSLLDYFPKLRQTFLMSATLSPELDALKALVVHNPAVIKLDETTTSMGLRQFYLNTPVKDKFLNLYTLIKLGVMSGKTLIFVNTLDGCYRLKLLMELFSINSAVLNSELPLNSRMHMLLQYNRGVFDYLIVTDDSVEYQDDIIPAKNEMDVGSDEEDEEDITESKNKDNKKSGEKKIHTDIQFGVARGFDFKNVNTVVNYDFPTTLKSYVHRIGRTARGGEDGDAVSFITHDDVKILYEVSSAQKEKSKELKMLPFDSADAERFRYRVDDISRSVTKQSIVRARAREIRAEMLNSSKLQAHWEDNPKELALLRHDQKLGSTKAPVQLQNVPSYLQPQSRPFIKGGVLGASRQKKRRKYDSFRKKLTDPLKAVNNFDSNRVPFKLDKKKRGGHKRKRP